MKLVKPYYEILTDISEGAKDELMHIERIGRVCYKSEDRITEDGDSAKKFVKMLINNGHEAMIEHSFLSVKFTTDRGVTHELVRHRIASFAQESTRYCNYTKDKFGSEISVIPIDGGLSLDGKAKGLTGETLQLIIDEWCSGRRTALFQNDRIRRITADRKRGSSKFCQNRDHSIGELQGMA